MMTIEASARAFVALEREARRLRDERNPIDCEITTRYESGVEWPGQRACFKDFCVEVGPEDPPTTRPVSEWCPACQRRQDLHVRYRAATKARGIEHRRLQALCRKEAGS